MEAKESAPFQNRGLEIWELRRKEWLSKSRDEPLPLARATDISPIIDVVFGNAVSQMFPSTPLPQMVSIMNDLWAAEALEE